MNDYHWTCSEHKKLNNLDSKKTRKKIINPSGKLTPSNLKILEYILNRFNIAFSVSVKNLFNLELKKRILYHPIVSLEHIICFKMLGHNFSVTQPTFTSLFISINFIEIMMKIGGYFECSTCLKGK